MVRLQHYHFFVALVGLLFISISILNLYYFKNISHNSTIFNRQHGQYNFIKKMTNLQSFNGKILNGIDTTTIRKLVKIKEKNSLTFQKKEHHLTHNEQQEPLSNYGPLEPRNNNNNPIHNNPNPYDPLQKNDPIQKNEPLQKNEPIHIKHNEPIRKSTKTNGIPIQNHTTTDLLKPILLTGTEILSNIQYECLGWRQTGGCDPNGERQPHFDAGCDTMINVGMSGYCEIRDRYSGQHYRVMHSYCRSSTFPFTCHWALEFANFKRFGDQFKAEIQPKFLPLTAPPTRGIVMAVYRRVLIDAFTTIKVLRHHGCTLPVELWHRPGEISKEDPVVAYMVEHMNVRLKLIHDPSIRKWLTKIYALFYSSFDQVLVLDCDNIPGRNPEYLFDTIEFQEDGAIFWPDYWRPAHSIFNVNNISMIWELVGTNFIDMFEQESGQLLIDRRKSMKQLNLVMYYATHFYLMSTMKLIWGDKDLFRLAWLRTEKSFHMIQTPAASAGILAHGHFCGVTLVQHDPKGNIIFFHRNQVKIGTISGNAFYWSYIQEFNGLYKDYDVRSTDSKGILPLYSDKKQCYGYFESKTANPKGYNNGFSVIPLNSTPFANLEAIALNFSRHAYFLYPKGFQLAPDEQ